MLRPEKAVSIWAILIDGHKNALGLLDLPQIKFSNK